MGASKVISKITHFDNLNRDSSDYIQQMNTISWRPDYKFTTEANSNVCDLEL